MSSGHYSIAGHPFKNNFCEVLSTLQQNQELVDMTLAADGHFVKVHQLVIALASPYLKELIASAQCQHPVIFLNNVSSQTLSLLLEYIYTGQVMVPEEYMNQLINTGKSLHVRGLEDLNFKKNLDKPLKSAKVERLQSNPLKRVQHTHLDSGHNIKKILISRGSELQQVTIPALAKNIKVENEPLSSDEGATSSNKSLTQDMVTQDTAMLHQNSEDDGDLFLEVMTNKSLENKSDQSITAKDKATVQFTTSIRGSLQVILNRYIYNFISLKQSSDVRRWRCIDYREKKCLAYVTTKGNLVLTRNNMHNHSFHDRKILEKVTKNSVFAAIEEAERFVSENAIQSS